ncbi:hypothetical protein L596_000443 [Steinernema carpocapsae]|uniref:Uncharacterized protein n=1 Tax=Steinernema carpocapsae TaxID=34508 RepID=A0A4U8UIV0_STECR|nr:hypothetical protein L596_000443 [Steinernema carpocapsae]
MVSGFNLKKLYFNVRESHILQYAVKEVATDPDGAKVKIAAYMMPHVLNQNANLRFSNITICNGFFIDTLQMTSTCMTFTLRPTFVNCSSSYFWLIKAIYC